MKKAYEESISETVLEDSIVPARGSWSGTLAKGQMLRIVDLKGQQAVDFFCYNARNYADRYAAADTMKINPAGIFLRRAQSSTASGSRRSSPSWRTPAGSTGRREDHRFLTGNGRYSADWTLPGELYAASRRSEVPAASMQSIDIADAVECPGVHSIEHVLKAKPAGLSFEGAIPAMHTNGRSPRNPPAAGQRRRTHGQPAV